MDKTLNYKSSDVHIRQHKATRNLVNRQCFCCSKRLEDNADIYMIFNNHKHFPNMLVHVDCFDSQKPDDIFSDMESAWADCKRLNELFDIEC